MAGNKKERNKSDADTHKDDKKRKEKKEKNNTETGIDVKEALPVAQKVARALFGCCGAIYAKKNSGATATPPAQTSNEDVEMQPTSPLTP
jgi:hypothetical protein